jgi:uncharacterized protein (DUF983 family)
MENKESKRSVLNLFKCKCPRCREGDMFVTKNPYLLKTTMKMNEECPVCGQPFNMEPGFYYGTAFVSYAFAVAVCAATFIAWAITIGFSLNDNRILYWLITNAIFLLLIQPYLMRLSRTIWLLFFISYDPNWKITPAKKPENVNKSQENNW